MLREEERPVTFRLVLTEPERCPSELGPPGGLHRLEFAESRPFGEHELRRLSPAADFYRSLIGVAVGEGGRLRIWGILQSGPRWVRSTQGGREQAPPLPPVAVIHTKGPGPR